MSYISGKCAKTRKLNHYEASRRAILVYDHERTHYRKKYFRTQKQEIFSDSKSDKTAGFVSEIAWIRNRQILNSKAPILSQVLITHFARLGILLLCSCDCQLTTAEIVCARYLRSFCQCQCMRYCIDTNICDHYSHHRATRLSPRPAMQR